MSGFNSGLVNFKGTPGFITDIAARRPATAIPNTVFFDTSTPALQQYVNGAWQNVISTSGFVPATRILTIAGVAQDLSADRTWNVSFASLTGKPTTLAGYGITDAVPASRTLTIAGTSFDLSADQTWTVSFASLTGKPTTVAGYGITDAITQNGNSFGATMVIGTNDAQAFRVNVNTIQRLLIANGGTTILTTAVNANGGINIKNNNATADNNWVFGIGTSSSGNNSEFSFWRSGTRLLDLTSTFMRWNGNEFNVFNGMITGINMQSTTGTALTLGGDLTGAIIATAGAVNLVGIGQATNSNFKPTSGTATFATLLVTGVINQTGGANGDTYGVRVGLTPTAVGGTWSSFYTDVNQGFCFQATGANAKLQIASSIKTGAPGGAAEEWKLGGVTAGVVVADLANYVEVSIGGVIVKLIKAV